MEHDLNNENLFYGLNFVLLYLTHYYKILNNVPTLFNYHVAIYTLH